MKSVYSIGENKPWRLTKESAHRLMVAIVSTESRIVASAIDTTCPPTCCIIRVEVPCGRTSAFAALFGEKLHLVEQIGGSSI
jgi:hypothetical protein